MHVIGLCVDGDQFLASIANNAGCVFTEFFPVFAGNQTAPSFNCKNTMNVDL
jgi:hypothetical protein